MMVSGMAGAAGHARFYFEHNDFPTSLQAVPFQIDFCTPRAYRWGVHIPVGTRAFSRVLC